MTLSTTKWTTVDYHRMIEAGILEDRQVELLHGDIIDMLPEGTPHAHLSSSTAEYLRELLGRQVQVREGKPITLSPDSEPQLDIAVVERLEDEYLEHHPYPENIFWLIEFSNSSLERDLQIKSKTYASAGIAEYWVVNLRSMELIVFRSPSQQGYQSEQVWTEEIVHPIAFPEVAVSLSRVLRRRA